MTVASPERVVPDTDLDLFTEAEFDIVCDIAALRSDGSGGWPPCKGDPARWVAWRPGCCSGGPRYRLVCDHCKAVYQKWQAHQALISCGYCGTETGGFASFTPLKGKS